MKVKFGALILVLSSCGDPSIETPPNPKVIQVAAGETHTCALLETGAVRCWGGNSKGQLGYGNTEDIGDDELPNVVGDVDVGGPVRQISAGSGIASNKHTCALLEAGTVRCWGDNSVGQLGYGNTETIGDDELPSSVGDVSVGGLVTEISVASAHTCALLEGGTVRCWGSNLSGDLGYGNTNDIGDDELPSDAGDVNVGGVVTQISVGGIHTCALLDTGSVRCWGASADGQLGYGNQTSIGDDELPNSAGDVDVGGPVTQVAAGLFHTCALLSTGNIRCWGQGVGAALGYGNLNDVGDDEAPGSAGDVNFGGATFTQFAAGGDHNCALQANGAIRCWGDNSLGQLGYGNTENIGDDELPNTVGDVQAGGVILQLTAGTGHTCALYEDGVRCWGSGSFGKLGYGNQNSLGPNQFPDSLGPVPLF